MPFGFLNPWFWMGAVAVGVPIWVHLSRRRPRNVRLFSALRFLHDQPVARRNPLRLRNVWLFAVRVLGLLLVVGAFAWPYLKGPDTAPIQESVVYVLDNTLSRQADGGFDRDRRRAVREIERAGLESQVAVVELAGSARVLASFSDDRAAAIDSLARLRPSFQRGSYLSAFAMANSLLANSLGEKKRLVFLSDNQENQWSEHMHTPAFLRGVTVELPKVEDGVAANVWLSEARVQRVFLGEQPVVNVSARLSYSGPARRAIVVLKANGLVVSSNVVELARDSAGTLLQSQWEGPSGEWLRGELTVEAEPDALAADNRVYFALAPLVEGKVTVLARSGYVRTALSPEIMRGQWSAKVVEPAELAGEVAAGPESDAEVLLVESGYLQSGDARKLVNRYLGEGRGVVLLVDRLTPNVTGALRELGIEAETFVTLEKDQRNLAFFAANHPMLHPFATPENGNLLEVEVNKYARLKVAEGVPLIFARDGSGLFLQAKKFRGKLLVAAFGLDREHTSWPVHPTFIPFLDLALQSARAEDATPQEYEPGQVASFQLPGAAGVVAQGNGPGRGLVLRGGGEMFHRVVVEGGRCEVRMPERPGLYALGWENEQQPLKVFSVNVPGKESELAYVAEPEALRGWQVPSGTKVAGSNGKVSLAGVLHQRLWWWMLLAGLGLLGAETAWANWRKAMA